MKALGEDGWAGGREARVLGGGQDADGPGLDPPAGDRAQQVHLLVPAGPGELAFLTVHAHRGPGRAVLRVAGDRRVQPGMAGSGPGQAIGPGLAERLTGRRLLPAVPLLRPAAALPPPPAAPPPPRPHPPAHP